MMHIEDNSAEVSSKISQTTDLMMGLMAAGIETQIKTSGNTPIDKGNLRSSAHSVKVAHGHYEVIDTAAYAAAQEAGQMTVTEKRVVTPDRGKTFFTLMPGIYTFKNYPRGGGAHWFQKAIDTVKAHQAEYARKAALATGMEVV